MASVIETSRCPTSSSLMAQFSNLVSSLLSFALHLAHYPFPADFGLSKEVSSPFQVTTTCCGTPGYTAPELKFDRPIVYRPYPVDIWALACKPRISLLLSFLIVCVGTIYEVAFARQIQSQDVVQQDIRRLRRSPNEVSRALGFLLWSCFRPNAADRPTIEQLETVSLFAK